MDLILHILGRRTDNLRFQPVYNRGSVVTNHPLHLSDDTYQSAVDTIQAW